MREDKDMQWDTRFLCRKPPQMVENKKLWGLRPTNLNPLFEIKLHIFI